MAPTPERRRLARPYLALALTAVAIHVVITFFRVRRSYFLLDDFRVFSLAHQFPLGGAYLLSNLNGHVEPLALLTHWAFFHTVG